MAKLWLCMVSCTQELFDEAMGHAIDNASEPLNFCVLGNGLQLSFDKHRSRVNEGLRMHFEANRGVPAALHEIYQGVLHCTFSGPEDVLCYIHDDFHILEKGWDQRVLAVFRDHGRCGLAGFGGSTGLGGDDIYKRPYEVHQLGRRNFFSNMEGAEAHGKRVTEEMPIVFTDGQSMIVKRELLDTVKGWSWWPFDCVHHAYDYGIACQARRHGYTAWLVPVACRHLNFRTASQPVYKDLAAKHGGDAAVHDKSHRFVYEEFRDVLPMRA